MRKKIILSLLLDQPVLNTSMLSIISNNHYHLFPVAFVSLKPKNDSNDDHFMHNVDFNIKIDWGQITL